MLGLQENAGKDTPARTAIVTMRIKAFCISGITSFFCRERLFDYRAAILTASLMACYQ
jgi:hypothetical protein